MKVGIVAEGPADIAVLRNILKGRLGMDAKDVLAIRPELSLDETDLAGLAKGAAHAVAPTRFSNWALVIAECKERTRIAEFVDSPLEGERFVVVHIDTAEVHLQGYDVDRPDRRALSRFSQREEARRLCGPKPEPAALHRIALNTGAPT